MSAWFALIVMKSIRRFCLTITFLSCIMFVAALYGEPELGLHVAIFADAGVEAESVETIERQLTAAGMDVTRLNASQILSGGLSADFDAIVFGGGMGNRQAGALGRTGREEIRRFVREGGGYVGICAGAYLACSGFNWSLGILNARTVSPQWRRGCGFVEIELTAAGQTITGMPAGTLEIWYANGPILSSDDKVDIPPFKVFAFFRSELSGGNASEEIIGDSPAILGGFFGAGRVLVSSVHPELTPNLRESFLPSVVRWVLSNSREMDVLSQ